MRKVTLSFDNGPTAEHTDAIVDLLGEHDVRASFFVVGEYLEAEGAREILERTHARGHWICNHTYTHGPPLGRNPDDARAVAEVARAQAAIGDLSHPDKFFRPNGDGVIGHHLLSRAVADYLADNGFTVVTWNNVPEDWTDPREQWVDRALAKMETLDWSLIVLHDFLTGPMLPTLGRFIRDARAAGAEFVQEFPPDCVHMRRGQPMDSLDSITMTAAARA